MHDELSDLIRRAEILQELHAAAEEVDDEVWLEKIGFETTRYTVTNEQECHDLWGAIAQQFVRVRSQPDELKQLEQLARPVLDRVAAQHVNLTKDGTLDERLPQWVEAAEQLLRSRLGANDS